jgi:hypothetical protein
VEVIGDRLLVSLSVRGTESARKRGGTAPRYQVLTVLDGRIVDIVEFESKTLTLTHAHRADSGVSARSPVRARSVVRNGQRQSIAVNRQRMGKLPVTRTNGCRRWWG